MKRFYRAAAVMVLAICATTGVKAAEVSLFTQAPLWVLTGATMSTEPGVDVRVRPVRRARARPVRRPAIARPGAVRPGINRPGVVVRNTRVVVRPWRPRPHYGAFVAGVALGAIVTVAVVGSAPAQPASNVCWYWEDPQRTQGYWDYCY